MKVSLCVILSFCLYTKQFVIAQETSSVRLSNALPEAGQSVTVFYSLSGSLLKGKSPISLTRYYWKNISEMQSQQNEIMADGNEIRITIRIPDSVRVFGLKFSNGNSSDCNNGKGYIYPIYNNGQIVQGALGLLSQIYFSGDPRLGIEVDAVQSRRLLRQEFANFPSSKPDFAIIWYFLLAASPSQEDKGLLEKELYDLLKIDREREWEAANYFFDQINKGDIADSIKNEIPRKFPKGERARETTANKISEETDATKMEFLYKAYIKNFPPNVSSQLTDDYVRNAVAKAFARENSVAKALEYANKIESETWRATGYAEIAEVLVDNGHYSSAKVLVKRAITSSYSFLTTRKNEEGARSAGAGYPSYNNLYAEILYHEKKYHEALTYVKEALQYTSETEARFNLNYARILMAMGRDKEAIEKLEEAVMNGRSTLEIEEMLRAQFVKIKGSDSGYREYVDALRKELVVKMKEKLVRNMINLPAPLFELKDLSGNTVSLKDLNGKILILDFWATWCRPCIRSFPAMQIAANRYKDDPNVRFLFINTMETVADPATMVKKFIDKNSYESFQVLLDVRDAATRTYPVAESFKVNAIPAKFVIDKNGNIRFKLAGFDGSEETTVEEIVAMIELVQTSPK